MVQEMVTRTHAIIKLWAVLLPPVADRTNIPQRRNRAKDIFPTYDWIPGLISASMATELTFSNA